MNQTQQHALEYLREENIITWNAITNASVTVSSCLIHRMWEPPVRSGGASGSVECSTTTIVTRRRVEQVIAFAGLRLQTDGIRARFRTSDPEQITGSYCVPFVLPSRTAI